MMVRFWGFGADFQVHLRALQLQDHQLKVSTPVFDGNYYVYNALKTTGSSPARRQERASGVFQDEDHFPLLRARKRARLSAQQGRHPNDVVPLVPIALPTGSGPDYVPYSKADSFCLYVKLDKDEGIGGISEQEFSRLFRKCARCCTVTTARIFKHHRCALPPAEVIDLTADDNDAA